MENLSVRNLLIESKVSDNLTTQIKRLNELSTSLKALAGNVNTVKGLTENVSDVDPSFETLKECSRLFKQARRNLVEAKSNKDLVKVHGSLKLAYNCMNDIDDLVEEVELSVHDILDVIEEAEKKKLTESGHEEYEEVFHAQEHDAEEVLSIIKNQGESAALRHLQQWHDPGNHMTRSDPGYGSDDEVYQEGDYILSYNTRFPSVSLVYRSPE